MKEIFIRKRRIALNEPCYVIAEMSANHGGSLDSAKAVIQAAKNAGADAVKLQTYRADTITLDSDKEDFRLPSDSPWESYTTFFALYEKAYTPWQWHKPLFEEAKRIGIDIFSSPFDVTAVELLEELDAPAYKIASPEITDIPLIKRVAQTGKPVIVSTGVSELGDIELAVKTLKENGCDQIILLKCTTAYPAPTEEINLLTIADLSKRFDCISGLSDHTLGIGIPIAAVAVGARVIEKHFIANKDHDSPDAFFSLDPSEFKLMIEEVRKAQTALGKVEYQPTTTARSNFGGRRSLYVSAPIKKGEKITSNNIKSVRPSMGLHPKHYDEILGKKVIQDLEKGDRLSLDLIDLNS